MLRRIAMVRGLHVVNYRMTSAIAGSILEEVSQLNPSGRQSANATKGRHSEYSLACANGANNKVAVYHRFILVLATLLDVPV
eukprot:1739925-Amphidinium_carterae.2